MGANSQLLLVAGGAAAIVLAFVWRTVARHRQMSRLNRGLRLDGDAAQRARAGNTLVELGLPRAAKPVLRAMSQEHDARVRLSVALAIARRQWEPTRLERVVNVRKWASDELDFQGHPVHGFGPAVTRLADMGGPRPEDSGPTPTGNGNGEAAVAAGTGTKLPADPVAAPTATVDWAVAPPAPGNGNGNGRAHWANSDDDATVPVPVTPPDGTRSSGPIRWVAPGPGGRTDR